MNTLHRGAVKKRFAMMHSGRSSCCSRLKLLYLVPALAACLWASAKAEEYKTYLNGKLVEQKKLEVIDSNTIKHVTVIHSQKKVVVETEISGIDTTVFQPIALPEDTSFTDVLRHP